MTRDAGSPAPRFPAWAAILAAAVLVAAIFPVSPLRSLTTGRPVPDVHLVIPSGYVVMAPLSNVLDTLTLLSLSQHVALMVSLAVVFGLWRISRRRRGEGDVRRSGLARLHAPAAAIVVVASFYAAMALLPRPMAGLRLTDPSLVAIDFHSHTDASHDARASFTVAANRTWHSAAGYGAAYISDHHSFVGVAAAQATNPARAGDGVMLLPALEAAYQEQHVIVLGSAHDAGTAPVRQWAGGHTASDADAGLILTIPGTLADFTPRPGKPPVRVLGIELSDACPRGLSESDARHASIIALADTINAALLTGSDNHGWGSTAVAWSVMTIPGWRALSADSLDARIRSTLRSEGRHAVMPIARSRVTSGYGVGSLALTAPAVAWTMLRTLSWRERVSWIVWCYGVALVAMLRSRRSLRARAKRMPVIQIDSQATPAA